jgi:hypothetical protein
MNISVIVYVDAYTSPDHSACDGTGPDADVHHYTDVKVTSPYESHTAPLDAGVVMTDPYSCMFTTRFQTMRYSSLGYRFSIGNHGSLLLAANEVGFAADIRVGADGSMSIMPNPYRP